jgi:hypothetical protein
MDTMEVDTTAESAVPQPPQPPAPAPQASTSKVSEHISVPSKYLLPRVNPSSRYAIMFEHSGSTTTRKLSRDRGESAYTETRKRCMGIPWTRNGLARDSGTIVSCRCVFWRDLLAVTATSRPHSRWQLFVLFHHRRLSPFLAR